MNYTEIIKLGNKLVDELSQKEGSDTTKDWMAHYIAELMIKAELANGAEKEKYEKECADTILKLWTHIDKVPNVDTPLRSFSNISEMCDKLITTEKYKYYPEKYKDEISPYLLLAQKVDSLAKEIVSLGFSLAIAEASEKEKEWLQFDMLEDIRFLKNIIYVGGSYTDEFESNEREKDRFRKNIEEFDEILKLLNKSFNEKANK